MHAISLRTVRSFLLSTALALPAACGEDDVQGTEQGPSAADPGTGQAQPADDCPERCADKAAECGAPPDVADAQCQGVCGGMLTEDQLTCLEDEDCAALQQAFLGSGSACDVGGGGSSGGGSNGTSSPTSSTNDAEIGDDCECGGGDVSFESCSGTGSSCGELTCYVFGGEGICSQPCTADFDGDDCPVGECVDHLIAVEVSVGAWCER